MATRNDGATQRRWEYQQVYLFNRDGRGRLGMDELNAEGAGGWELVAIVTDSVGDCYGLMKREAAS